MFAQVNNTRLFYVVRGSGEPIIFAHGNGESHKIFDEAINFFSQSYTVYALDTRGHGESQKIGEVNYGESQKINNADWQAVTSTRT